GRLGAVPLALEARLVGAERGLELLRRLEAVPRLLLESLQDDRLEVLVYVGVDRGRGSRALLQDLRVDLGRRLAAEGARLRAHLVEDDAHGEDVAPRVDVPRLAARLLGREVEGRAQDLPRLREPEAHRV